jgi:hypothetical protein
VTVPTAVTVATVEEELPAVTAYAQRHGWSVNWKAEELRLIFDGRHPTDATPIRIVASVVGYRALPPAWTFEDPEGKRSLFPRAGPVDGKSSIFHQDKRRICAPFNRLAYSQEGGPHSDWGGPDRWLEIRGHIHATTLANMLASVLGHLKASPGVC